MLMSSGLLLAVGLLAAINRQPRFPPDVSVGPLGGGTCLVFQARLVSLTIIVAAGMMAVGLLLSYSRGACLGTAIGVVYLAKLHRKLKWQFILSGILVVTAMVWSLWNFTADTSPWYVKRMDFGRPSAQHRVAAWHGALKIMWDHPQGIGWNNTVEVYKDYYSPPEDGADAITTNDYLMLATQLGLAGLFCFATYVVLVLWSNSPRPLGCFSAIGRSDRTLDQADDFMTAQQWACHSAAFGMLVAFWFDGGLFKLPTAAVFWILFELGRRDEDGNFNPMVKCSKMQQTQSELGAG
jgi:hypothetical protein